MPKTDEGAPAVASEEPKLETPLEEQKLETPVEEPSGETKKKKKEKERKKVKKSHSESSIQFNNVVKKAMKYIYIHHLDIVQHVQY